MLCAISASLRVPPFSLFVGALKHSNMRIRNLFAECFARAGDIDSCYFLGVALQDGKGIRVDGPHTQQLFLRAANDGNHAGSMF